jgi:hypothetical protein
VRVLTVTTAALFSSNVLVPASLGAALSSQLSTFPSYEPTYYTCDFGYDLDFIRDERGSTYYTILVNLTDPSVPVLSRLDETHDMDGGVHGWMRAADCAGQCSSISSSSIKPTTTVSH